LTAVESMPVAARAVNASSGAGSCVLQSSLMARKNPHAVALGRLGGKAGAGKGAAARFAAMSKEEKRALAQKAAAVRWAKKRKKG